MKNSIHYVPRICLFLCAVLLLIMTLSACSASKDGAPDDNAAGTAAGSQHGIDIPVLKDKEVFALSSGDLRDGVWDTVITNTQSGSNVSPQLSWEAVDGAECYAIYMVDTDAMCWIHWKSNDVTVTELQRGWATEKEYIGPYPPEGTHDYEIFVFALKSGTDRLKGSFNNSDPRFADHVGDLDKSEGGGNIIAYGHISGTYTSGT